ncbi:T9SS type A sorting domain-containing protein [Labilibacter sediminis]|nr:T9SS type A sorting domain-containing protein [Labilibacter sediminis]
MKKGLLLIFAVVAYVTASAQLVNVIPNASFETWTDANGMADNWTTYTKTANGVDATFTQATDEYQDGNASLKITIADNGGGGKKPWDLYPALGASIPVGRVNGDGTNDKGTLSVWAKGAGKVMLFGIGRKTDNSEVQDAKVKSALIDLTSSWQLISIDYINIDAAGLDVDNVMVRVNCGSNTDGTGAYIYDNSGKTIYFDNFEFIGDDDATAIGSTKIQKLNITISPDKSQLVILTDERGTAEIYNLSGSLVKQQQVEGGQSVSIAGLQSGMYIVKINNKTAKFVK